MKMSEIRKQLKGFFVETETVNQQVVEKLCFKDKDNTYHIVEPVDIGDGRTMSALDNCLEQVNNQILDPTLRITDLKIVLPFINADVFKKHKQRQKQIDKKNELCLDVFAANEYDDNRYVIKKKVPARRHFDYFIINEETNEVVRIDASLLTEEQRENAVLVSNIKAVKSAIKDDLLNEYDSILQYEIDKYEQI